MRELLLLACRAFPREHRARRSDEIVDTALLAANGSAWRAAREALSLVAAGMRQRLRAEANRSLRDGLAPLAGLVALVNLAVALAGISLGVHPPPQFPVIGPFFFHRNLYVLDWWWIAFGVAAAGIVFGLIRGDRRLALGAALANLGLVGYDAVFLASGTAETRGSHLAIFTYAQIAGFPVGRQWLVPAVVLALAIAAAPLRRLPLRRVLLTFLAAVLIVCLARETWGGFFVFLHWPLAVIAALAIAFAAFGPRLAVVGVGVTLAAAPSVAGYLTTPYIRHASVVTWAVAAGLTLGVVLPLAQLTRRRLT